MTTIAAPWEGLTKHFTVAFESMALLLTREMSAKSAAAFVGDMRLWCVLNGHLQTAPMKKI